MQECSKRTMCEISEHVEHFQAVRQLYIYDKSERQRNGLREGEI